MAKKILLIEDDPFLSEIYVIKFKEAGFEISLAQDGSLGLEKVKEEMPDLVLLDIVMPTVDGLEVLRAMKSDETTRNIPVVILSNLGEQEDIKKGLELGAEFYIVKAHYTPTEVVARVKATIEKK
jgi:DNA-binding response OmpR family regulator